MPKLNRGCKMALTKRKAEDLHLGFESHYVRIGGRKRRKASLSTAELKALAQMVVGDGVTPRDAALVFNVKPVMVWKLVREVRLAEHSYDCIRSKQEGRKHKRAEAAVVVTRMLKEGRHMGGTEL